MKLIINNFLLSKKLCISELFLYVIFTLLGCWVIAKIDLSGNLKFIESLKHLNLINLFAWFVALQNIKVTALNSEIASKKDILSNVFFLLCILIGEILGIFQIIGFLMFVISFYYIQRFKSNNEIRKSSIVLLAISGNIFWSPLIYQLALPGLINADAFLLGNLLKVIRPDILWSGAGFQSPDGRTISLVGYCSSFQSLSIALLAYVAMVSWIRGSFFKKDLLGISLTFIVLILLNDIRLILCVWSKESFLYWHDGNGSVIYQNVANLVIFIIAYFFSIKIKK